MYAIYLSAPRFYDVVPHPAAWMNVTFNRDRRAFMAAVDGRREFAFHSQLRMARTPRCRHPVAGYVDGGAMRYDESPLIVPDGSLAGGDDAAEAAAAAAIVTR